MVKTLIRPNWPTCYFWVLTTFLVECSIFLASCTFVHGVGYLGIHTWIGCMYFVDFLLFLEEVVMEHFLRRIIILFIFSCTLEGALSEFS
jgi:hypothetical protein